MAKKIIADEKKELLKQLENQTKKLNFLIDASEQIKTDSMLSPVIEREFLDNGYSELYGRIKCATTDATLAIISAQIEEEEIIIKNLMNKLMG